MNKKILACASLIIIIGIIAPSVQSADDGEAPEWPALAEADIRPGVRVLTDGSQCTSNFLFRDLDDGGLLLGLAAHCVDHEGQESVIQSVTGDEAATGVVEYSSFEHTDSHDFALIRIPTDAEARVHPAVLHFGGPTGIVDSGALQGGERILFYGNSGVRMGVEQTNWHEGILTTTGEYKSAGHAVTPGIPGDSGSGVVDAQGRAVGVLVTLGLILDAGGPTPLTWTGTNGITNLDAALEFAEANAGLRLELQTWEMLTEGVVPVPMEYASTIPGPNL